MSAVPSGAPGLPGRASSSSRPLTGHSSTMATTASTPPLPAAMPPPTSHATVADRTETAGRPAPARPCGIPQPRRQPGRRTAARPLGRTGKQMNRGLSGDALDHAEKPGGAEQLADRRLRPSRRDHRADYRKQHLSQHPGSIVGGVRGRAAHPGTGQAGGQVHPITQQGERHHRPGEPPNGASRHQLTSTRLRRSLRRHQADPADPTRSSFWTAWLASSTAQSGADTRSRTARSCRGQGRASPRRRPVAWPSLSLVVAFTGYFGSCSALGGWACWRPLATAWARLLLSGWPEMASRNGSRSKA